MILAKKDKIQLIEARMNAISREAYNQNLNLLMYEAYKEKAEVIAATQNTIEKQAKSYEALAEELEAVNQSVE